MASDDESAGSYGSEHDENAFNPSAPSQPLPGVDADKPSFLPRLQRDKPIERSNTMPLKQSSRTGLFKSFRKTQSTKEEEDDEGSLGSGGSKHSHEKENPNEDEGENEDDAADDEKEINDEPTNIVPFIRPAPISPEQRKSLLPGQVPIIKGPRSPLSPKPSLSNFDRSGGDSPSRPSSDATGSAAASAPPPPRHPLMLGKINAQRTLRRSQFLSALDLQLAIVKMTESGIISANADGGKQKSQRHLEIASDTESDEDEHSDEDDEREKEVFISDMRQTSPKTIQRQITFNTDANTTILPESRRTTARSPSPERKKTVVNPPSSPSAAPARAPSVRAPSSTPPVRSRRRSTVILTLDHGTQVVVTHEKKMAKKKARMRRHSISGSSPPAGVPLTMFHELRQFYDLSYRVFLVKAQLRSLAMATLQISPFVPRTQRMTKEAAWLFSLVDEDGSGFIDVNELKIMIRETGQKVKDEEVEHIMQLLDIDGSGEVDNVEFLDWYMDDKDIWLSKRRRNKADVFKDTALLQRESMRFHPAIKKLIVDFWRLVDVDGNGQIDPEEYIELSIQLQEAMHGKGKSKFDQDRAIAVAKKEWQVDSQGFDYLNYHRFQLCFFQIADAWAKAPSVQNYVKVLVDLLNKTSFVPKSGGQRKWKWNRIQGEEEASVESGPKIESEPKKVKLEKPPPTVIKVEKISEKPHEKAAKSQKTTPKKELVRKLVEAPIAREPPPPTKEETVVDDPLKQLEASEEKEEVEKKGVIRATPIKPVSLAPQVVDRKPLFTAATDEEEREKERLLVKKKSDREAAKAVKELELAAKKLAILKMEPSAPVFAQASYHSEEEDEETKKARGAAENFTWEPPEELFSPGKSTKGVAGGGFSGVHSYNKIDKEETEALDVWRKNRRASVVEKNTKVAARSKVNIDFNIRKKMNTSYIIELITYQQANLMERTRRIGDELFYGSNFADTQMLFKMVNKLKELAKENEGKPPTEDELSLGYAARKLLENWKSKVDREEELRAEVPEVGDHKLRRMQLSSSLKEVAIPGSERRTERRSLSTVIRPKSSSGLSARNNDDARARSSSPTSPRDGPGIGPLFDSDRVMYPLSVMETDVDVVYQTRNVVTGKLRVPPAAAAAGHTQPFFLNAWEKQRAEVVDAAREMRGAAAQRPNTAGAVGERKKTGVAVTGTPPIAPRGLRKTYEGGKLMETLEDAFAVRRRQRNSAGGSAKNQETFEMPNVFTTKSGKTFTRLFE